MPECLPLLLNTALQQLHDDQLVVIPTETVYGLAGNARSPRAIQRIFELKQRPQNHPLIVHLASAESLPHWACDIPPVAYELAETFWPGPLTLVLPKAAHVLDEVTAQQNTVALRVPAHPLTLELLRQWEPHGGLAAPSANRFTQVSPTTSDHVRKAFGADTPFILEGGACRWGIESTILDLSSAAPRLLRPGSVSVSQLQPFFKTDITVIHADSEQTPRVPGMHAVHYAPQTPAFLWTPETHLPHEWLTQHWTVLDYSRPKTWPSSWTVVNMPNNPIDYAAQLYACFHEVDQQHRQGLLIEQPPQTLEWMAVMNRLLRSSRLILAS